MARRHPRATVLAVFAVLGALGSTPVGGGAASAGEATPVCPVSLAIPDTNLGGLAALEFAIDGDGDRVAFISERDHDGSNPDGSREVWLSDLTAGTLIAVTHGDVSVRTQDLSMTADGTTVVYATVTAGNDTAPISRIQAYDVASGTTTLTKVDAFGPEVSADGSLVLFASNQNLDGSHTNPLRSELWVVPPTGGTVTRAVGAATDADQHHLSGDASTVVWAESSGGQDTILTAPLGGDPSVVQAGGSWPELEVDDDGSTIAAVGNPVDQVTDDEVWVFDAGAGERVSPDGEPLPVGVDIDGAGDRVVWFAGRFPDSDIRLFDRSDAQLVVLGFGVSFSPGAAISTDGRRVLGSDRDSIGGTNPTGNLELFVATCAAAGPLGEQRPDALVQRIGHPYRGDAVHGTDGTGQTAGATVAPGHAVSFYVRIENDGSAVDDLVVRGQGSNGRFRVTYQRGGPRGADVTADVVDGTFRLEDRFPGDVAHLRVTVTPRRSAPAGATTRRLVTVASAANAAREDAVRMVVTRR